MDQLRPMLLRHGAAAVAYADLDALPHDPRHDCPCGISIAVALDPAAVATIQQGPSREYYQEYCRTNELLDELSAAAVVYLEDLGFRSIALPATEAAVDAADATITPTPLPHKTVATRAGLGWIGKCALLVTEAFGSAIRITTVLTHAELPPGQPINSSRCGSCAACVEACPAHVPTGIDWKVDVPRERLIDPLKCRSTARELARTRAGVEQSICGICIAACPWTRKYIQRSARD